MRKQLLIFALLVGSLTASAQQLPLISSYLNTAYLFNPAFSGIEVRQRFQSLIAVNGRIFKELLKRNSWRSMATRMI